ncbi:MAG: hypothetical protein GF375_01645 [Candidatus Omnitrophica bacterium]|nr:hypothetical protein [Candidatus Omnitrophota bacterium]
MVRDEIERLKQVYETIKNDKEAKAIIKEGKAIMDAFLKKGDKDIMAKLTGYADVDETIALAHKGQKMREAYQARSKAIHFITNVLQVVSRFMPVVKEAAEAADNIRKTAKKSVKKSLKRRKK